MDSIFPAISTPPGEINTFSNQERLQGNTVIRFVNHRIRVQQRLQQIASIAV